MKAQGGLWLVLGGLATWASVCAFAVGTGAAAVSQAIHVNVDADGYITMTFDDTTPIGTLAAPGTVIPAGTYRLVVNNNIDDEGEFHKFHLKGPGVDYASGSGVQTVQTSTTVTFQAASVYSYVDDAFPKVAPVWFSTPGGVAPAGSNTAPTTTTPAASGSSSGSVAKPSSEDIVGSTSTALQLRGTLDGTVTATGVVALRKSGKTVTSLRVGRYRLRVVDHASADGFTIRSLKGSPTSVSGVPFVGTHTATVTLRAGQWLYYATQGAKSHYFLVTG